MAETVLSIAGSKCRLVFMPLPADDPHQRQPDNTVAKDMLAWSPTVSLDEGLNATVAYFKNLLAT